MTASPLTSLPHFWLKEWKMQREKKQECITGANLLERMRILFLMTPVTKCTALQDRDTLIVYRWWTVPADGKFDHKPFLIDDYSTESIALPTGLFFVSVVRTICLTITWTVNVAMLVLTDIF